MSKIIKCDKCGDIVKDNNDIEINIYDMNRFVLENSHVSFELCAGCAEKNINILKQIFD